MNRVCAKVFVFARSVLLVTGALSSGCTPRAHAAFDASPIRTEAELLKHRFVDEDGKSFTIGSRLGVPMVLTTFYRTCTARCPMTVGKLKRVDAAFSAAGIEAEFVLVSLDPLNDTPERLEAYRESVGIANSRWHVVRGDVEDTQSLAKFLHVRMIRDDTHIDHDVQIATIDRRGAIAAVYTGWSFAEADLVRAAMR